MGKPSYQVRVRPSGERFECLADQPLLDAAHAADVLIAYSCRSGQCRSCLGRVIAGEISYPHGRPPALTAADTGSGRVLFCSAYPVSDLTIELLPPEF